MTRHTPPRLPRALHPHLRTRRLLRRLRINCCSVGDGLPGKRCSGCLDAARPSGWRLGRRLGRERPDRHTARPAEGQVAARIEHILTNILTQLHPHWSASSILEDAVRHRAALDHLRREEAPRELRGEETPDEETPEDVPERTRERSPPEETPEETPKGATDGHHVGGGWRVTLVCYPRCVALRGLGQLVQLRLVVGVKRKQCHRGERRVRLDPCGGLRGEWVSIRMVTILNRHARTHCTHS